MIRPTSRTRDCSCRRGDSGETLVETIITLILLSAAVVPIMLMLVTSIDISSAAKDSSMVVAQESTRAERYLALDYVPCGQATDYRTADFVNANPLPAGYTDTLTVRYLVSSSSATPTYSDSCAGAASDQGVQQLVVTITLSGRHRPVVGTLVVLKRQDACSAAAQALPGYVAGQRC